MRAIPRKIRVAGLCLGITAALPALASTDLELWHALSGPAGEQLSQLAQRFNASQGDFRVVPIHKGGNDETVKAGIEAQRAAQGPHMLHVDEEADELVAATPAAFRPAFQVMQEARQPLDSKAYLESVSERFSDERGRLVSMPLNTSTPVLYYNRDAFVEAGLDPDDPPRTWMKVQEASLKLAESYFCTYTTDRPAWVHIENLLSWHNEPLSEKGTGRNAQEKLVFNARLVMKHVGLLMSWVKSGLFSYFGRGAEAVAKFSEGECAMLTSASSSYADIVPKARFKLGVSPLPFHDEVPGAPFSTLVGGGSLWAMAGKKAPEYRGVAQFFSFLAKPEVQAQWHQATGFLPATTAAFELSSQQGFYQQQAGSDVALRQIHGKMLNRARKDRAKPAAWLRAIANQELEDVWAARKTPKEAIDNTVERGNKHLQLIGHRAAKPAAKPALKPAAKPPAR